MNLTEYLTQPHVKYPVVYLQNTDIEIKDAPAGFKYIFIPEIKRHFKKQGLSGLYVAKKNERNLYTVDADGCAKIRSVFFLPFDFWE